MKNFIVLVTAVMFLFLGSCSSFDRFSRFNLDMDAKAALSTAINYPDKLMPSYSTMDLSDRTGIIYLMGMRNIEAVKKALRDNIKINEIKKDKKTPLGEACYQGYLTIVELLLNRGADPNFQDGEGMFPILYASKRNVITSQEIIKVLVSKGAKLNVVDSEGNTILHLVASHFLEQTPSKADVDSIEKTLEEYKTYYQKAYVNTIQYLLSAGMDPNYQNKNGETALSLLINNFTELKKENELGRHLLYLQKAEYAVYIANALINANAIMNKPKTPLDFWLLPLVGLTSSQKNESLIDHCARMDYFNYDYIYTAIQMNCDKSYKSKNGGLRAYDWLLQQMQFNVPKSLELAKTLKNKDVNINDKIFIENENIFRWLNIDIKNWSGYQNMYSLEGTELTVSQNWDSFKIAFLIVSRIEDYDKLVNLLK